MTKHLYACDATQGRIQELVERSEMPVKYEPDRCCAEQGCITVLTTYNPGPWCFTHRAQHEAATADGLTHSQWRGLTGRHLERAAA